MRVLRRAARLLVALMRELADENAYRRYLAAHGRAHSPRAWQEFSERRLLARFVRPRCC